MNEGVAKHVSDIRLFAKKNSCFCGCNIFYKKHQFDQKGFFSFCSK